MAVALCLYPFIENNFEKLLKNKCVQMQENDAGKKDEKAELQEELQTKTDAVQTRLRKRTHDGQLSWLKKRRYKEKSSSSSSSCSSSSTTTTSDSDSTNSEYNVESESEDSDQKKINTNVTTTSGSISTSPTFPNPPVYVPPDPHVWTAQDIASWIKWLTRTFEIVPEPDINRFPRTGAALCEMSRPDFWVCAGSRSGGCLIAKHFAIMLHSSTGRETSPMLNDNEPSECQANLLPIINDDEVGQLISLYINLKWLKLINVNVCSF